MCGQWSHTRAICHGCLQHAITGTRRTAGHDSPRPHGALLREHWHDWSQTLWDGWRPQNNIADGVMHYHLSVLLRSPVAGVAPNSLFLPDPPSAFYSTSFLGRKFLPRFTRRVGRSGEQDCVYRLLPESYRSESSAGTLPCKLKRISLLVYACIYVRGPHLLLFVVRSYTSQHQLAVLSYPLFPKDRKEDARSSTISQDLEQDCCLGVRKPALLRLSYSERRIG